MANLTGLNAKLLNVALWRITVLVLLALGIGLQWYWVGRDGSSDRTISVTGSKTIEAAPDKYIFYPSYESSNTDQAAAQKEVSTKSSQVVARLKELGVPNDGIAVSQSTYDTYRTDVPTKTTSASVTITVKTFEIAQKVQDYLLETEAVGQITPVAGFSEEKRKTLEREGTAAATDDAKANAEQKAKQLGVKLGKVVSSTDNSYGSVYPTMGAFEDKAVSSMGTFEAGSATGMSVQPGLNEVSFSVSVVYSIK